MSFRSSALVIAALCAVACGRTARADVDTLITVVSKANAVPGSNAIGTFGYNPITDTAWTASFGGGAQVRRINNVFGAQTVDLVASETEAVLFYREGNPDRSASTLLMSGMVLNPKPIGAIPAYSFAIISDAETTRLPLSTTIDPAASKRIYSYNLQLVDGPAPSPPATSPPYHDGRDVFTPIVSLKNMQDVAGITTGTTSNTGRQAAFSGDGQSVYFIDSSDPTTAVGGLWKVNALGGTPVRLLAADDINTEPAVVTQTVATPSGTQYIDSIYVRGGGTTGNTGGIDKIVHDGTTTSARTVAVTSAAMADFLEAAAGTAILSMGSDSAGNVYFNNTNSSPERRGIFRLDPQGRLSKVVGYNERKDEYGGTPNSNTLRMQVFDKSYNNGADPAFNVPMIMYAESTALNLVAGAWAFKPGDFNRDNNVTSADINLFKPKISLRGAAITTLPGFTAADYKYDLNGNNVVDWKDVKVLQQFADFGNGDADLNGVVDNLDFQTLQTNYGVATTKTWLQGDFTGDNIAGIKDFFLLQNSMNYQSSVLTGVVPVPLDMTAFAAFIASKVTGDFNLDNQISSADVTAMLKALANLSSFESTNSMSDANLLAVGDVNGDGIVNNFDIQPLLAKISGAGSLTPVPEPSTAVLLLVGLGFTLYKRPKKAVRQPEVCA